MSKAARIPSLTIHTTQGGAGMLVRASQFVVRYSDDALARPQRAISLTMPPRPEGWKSDHIPPVLAMNLPEGFLLHRVFERFRKVMDTSDDMNLLAVTSTPSAGRVWTSAPGKPVTGPGVPIALRDILAYRGTEALFDDLLDRYGTPALSGVQPKVLVPEDRSEGEHIADKSAARSPDLIVKSAGAEYPGLAENEHVCMSLARHVGVRTPDCWLSENRDVFVIRRFDIGPHGYLGFEDMAALTGRHPSRKYEASYADVARAVSDFCAPRHRAASLDELFRLIVLNCVIRNGDAHLKNFGIVYGDPATAVVDARLAPAYDLVCTTVYLKHDTLALALRGERAWPHRRTLERFGAEACEVTNPGRVIDEVIDNALDFAYQDPESVMWQRIREQVRLGGNAIRGETARRRSAH